MRHFLTKTRTTVLSPPFAARGGLAYFGSLNFCLIGVSYTKMVLGTCAVVQLFASHRKYWYYLIVLYTQQLERTYYTVV